MHNAPKDKSNPLLMFGEILKTIRLCITRIFAILFGKHRKLNRLSRLPRYTKGNYPWKGGTFEFPDAASFSYIYKELFIEEIYKFDAQSDRPFIIDCGANMGLSVLYFKETYPTSRVLAFEPERTVFSYLKKNVENLRLQDVELMNKAVWSKNEKLLFNNEGADASRLASLETNGEGFGTTYEVEAVRLSEFIDREVDLLKIDIEGAEGEVIREIEPRLGLVKHIFIEYHSLANSRQELGDILDILSAHNFRYYVDTTDRMKRRPFVDKDTYLNFDAFLNIYATRQ
jgi:FkbM family methyltransferase